MNDDFESVDVTDETNTTITYYSESDVIKMKQVSFWTGSIIWFIVGASLMTVLFYIFGG